MTARDRRVLVSAGFLICFALLMPVLGFFAAAALFLVGHMLFLGIRNPLTLGGATAGLLLVAWGLFEHFLGVPLPHGLIY